MTTRHRSASLAATALLLLSALPLAALPPVASAADPGMPEPPLAPPAPLDGVPPEVRDRVAAAMASPELLYEPNLGQAPEAVRFVARAGGVLVHLLDDGLALHLAGDTAPTRAAGAPPFSVAPPEALQAAQQATLVLRFEGAGRAVLAGADAAEVRSSYLLGSDPSGWLQDVPSYREVRYTGLYPGVDLVVRGTPEHPLKYDLLLAPGADPAQVVMVVEGAQGLALEDDGALAMRTTAGDVTQAAPFVYQDLEGKRVEVAGAFQLLDEQRIGFALGPYDPEHPLVIDPGLVYATISGSYGYDYAQSAALDAAGNAYVAGYTQSSTFPVRNATMPEYQGWHDAFVAKFSPAGAVLWSTFFGGKGSEYGHGLAVDAGGNVVLASSTSSTDLPVLGAFQATNAGSIDAFVARFSPSGALLSSTYVGGASDDGFTGLALDASGNIVAVGYSYSTGFPVLNAVQPAKVGTQGASYDAVVVKMNPTASALVFSTYYGGSSNEGLSRVAVDGSGNIVAGGHTFSSDVNVTANAYQASKKIGWDALLLRLTSAGAKNYATYFGGTSDDYLNGLVVDGSGNILAGGYTYSTDMPVTAASQPVHGGGGEDGWAVKMNSNGASLAWMTYIGGAGYDVPTNLAIDPAGNTYQSVYTSSINYPGTRLNGALCSGESAIVKRAANGTVLLNKCLTAPGSTIYDLAVDATQKPLVVGYAVANGGVWPVLNAAQASSALGASDAVLARLHTNLTWYDFSTFWGGTSESAHHGMAFRTSDDVAFVAGSLTFQFAGWGTPGPFNPLGGSSEAQLRGYKANGALWYAIILGGSGADEALDVAVAPNGDVVVTGWTTSTDMPLKSAAQTTLKGAKDAFVAKFRPGAALNGYNFSTYLGGTLDDIGRGVAFDGSGNAIVVGETLSTDFPTAAPRQAAKSGAKDAFATKMNLTGGLVYSTYHGGTLDDIAYDAAADAAGNAYVVGWTNSTNFPVAAGFDSTANGAGDGFASKLNAAGSALSWSSYLGGSGPDEARGAALDNAGALYVAGIAGSANFPVASAYDATLGGTTDAFLTKVTAAGTGFAYSTLFGGSTRDGALAVTVNATNGEPTIAGYTNSPDLPRKNAHQEAKFPCAQRVSNIDGWYCLPVNSGSYQFYQNATDGFVAKFVAAGNTLDFSTYLGSWYDDELRGVAVDDKGNTIVGGMSDFYYVGQASPSPTWLNHLSWQRTVATIAMLARCDPPPESTSRISTGIAGNDNWWRSQVTMAFTSSSFCPISQTWYSADGGAPVQGTTHIFNTQGNHTASFYAIDVDGNQGPTNASWVRIDSVAPSANVTLTGTAGLAGWWRSSVVAAYTASDAPQGSYITSGVDARHHRADVAPWQSCAATGTCQDALTTDGLHNVSYYAEDVAGNKGAVQVRNVSIDKTAPASAAQVDGPEGENGWYKGPVTVFLTATDATSGVASIKYRVDGGGWSTFTSFFSIGAEHCHTLDRQAFDVAGNAEPVQSLEVCIDSAPPTVEITTTEEGNVYLFGVEDPLAKPTLPLTLVVGDVTLTAEASDAASGVDRVEWYVDGVLRHSAAAAPYAFPWEAGKEGLGTHTIVARAWDRAGWDAADITAVFTVPTTVEGVGRSCRDDLSLTLPPESPVFLPPEVAPKVCAPVRAMLVDTLPTIPPALPPEPPALPPVPPEPPALPDLPEVTPPEVPALPTLPPLEPPALPPEPPALPPEPPALPPPPELPALPPEPPALPPLPPEPPEELSPAAIELLVESVLDAVGL